MAIVVDKPNPPGTVGYFVWERDAKHGARPAKFHIERDGMNKWSDDDWKAKTLGKWPLVAVQFELSLDTLAVFFPCPEQPAAPVVEPDIEKVSMFATLRRLDRGKDGHVIAIDGSHESYNVGVINLAPGWKTGARVKWSIELAPVQAPPAVAEHVVPPSPKPLQPTEAVNAAIANASREWHHSHNVSDSMFTCYGCGKEAGDPLLYEPCPTPDHVGQMAIESEKRKAAKTSA